MKRIRIIPILLLLFSASLSEAQTYLPPKAGDWEQIAPDELGWCSDSLESLYTWLEDQNSRSFILLKDGKIVVEKYFGNATESSVWYWASAGKTLRTLLFGIAQREGELDLEDRVSAHIDTGWTNCCIEKEHLVKIKHLLTMTSGLDDDVEDPYCSDDTCLRYFMDAGSRWAYHNGPYNLTRNILEAATGETLNDFTRSRVLDLIGMSGSWIPSGYNTLFWSNARSMARFGLLIQNGGDWGFQPVLADTAYFEAMTNTSQTLNPAYGYLWWLNGKSSYMVPGSQLRLNGSLMPQAPSDLIAALGADDQKIYVVPSEGLVVVRQGNAGKFLLPMQFDRELWKRIGNLSCGSVSSPKSAALHDPLELSLNGNMLTWSFPDVQSFIEILDNQGRVIERTDQRAVVVTQLPPGLYIVRLYTSEGIRVNRKFVKHSEF
ncbi:MAG: serine hydrolase [Flavobacteriales bacterium]|nr:serine hydrolase [Flavobacteriales bacterium]